jgi:hypothetical protein
LLLLRRAMRLRLRWKLRAWWRVGGVGEVDAFILVVVVVVVVRGPTPGALRMPHGGGGVTADKETKVGPKTGTKGSTATREGVCVAIAGKR